MTELIARLINTFTVLTGSLVVAEKAYRTVKVVTFYVSYMVAL